MHHQTHNFKGFQDWIEVFRAGEHKDSKGRKCLFSTDDLDQIVTNAKTTEPAPATLGHRSVGQAENVALTIGLKREGDTLLAKFGSILPAFESAVASGAYRYRSVGLVKDASKGWVLDHVAWLGAVPPAITGLKPVDFSGGVDSYWFSNLAYTPVQQGLSDALSLLGSLRTHFINEYGFDITGAEHEPTKT
ncbi:MAG: hypothetical protein ACEQSK_20355 [Sphingomonadaceae bacterium]